MKLTEQANDAILLEDESNKELPKLRDETKISPCSICIGRKKTMIKQLLFFYRPCAA